MLPIRFAEQNVVFAKDQPEYQPLPALKLDDPATTVISCWRLGFWERVRLVFTGKIWVRMLTFGHPLQPQSLSLRRPFIVVSQNDSK